MEHRAAFIFYGNLIDFLPAAMREPKEHVLDFNGSPAVKDTIESAGVPHPEICALKIDGQWASLEQKLLPGQKVEVYPFDFFGAPPENSRALTLPRGQRAEQRPAFIVDANLGKLVRRLRLLGFDALWQNNADDAAIAKTAAEQNRIVLTRDKNLLKHKIIEYGYWVRSDDPAKQIVEVTKRYRLIGQIEPFSRCISCNGIIQEIAKEEIYDRLLPVAREHYEKFFICTGCAQIFWEGPHYEKMIEFIEELKKS